MIMPKSVVRFCSSDLAAAVILLLIPLTLAFPIHQVDGPKPWWIVPSRVVSRINRNQHGQLYQGARSVTITTKSTTGSTSPTGITTRYDPSTALTTTTRSSQQRTRVIPNKKTKESVATGRRSIRKKTALIPLSPNPLLFVSSSPLLTPQECEIVSEWCRAVETRGESIADLLRSNNQKNIKHPQEEGHDPHYDQKGILVMKKLQRLVHHSVLGMGSTNRSQDSKVSVVEDDYVVPRFLHYQSSEGRTRQECHDDWQSVTVDQLIPDGLHVDTNNNKHFRHW